MDSDHKNMSISISDLYHSWFSFFHPKISHFLQKMADFSKTPKNEVEKLVLIQIAPQHMTFIEKNYSYYKKVKSWLVLASFWLIWLNFRHFYTRPRSNDHEMFLSSFCAEYAVFIQKNKFCHKIRLSEGIFGIFFAKMADFPKIRKNEDHRQTDDGVDFIRPLHQQVN